MAIYRLLVRRRDNHRVASLPDTPAGRRQRRQLWRRGDIIAIHPDGKTFGNVADTHPAFRVIEVELDEAEVAALMEQETRINAEGEEVTVRRRRRKLDMTALRTKLTTGEQADYDKRRLRLGAKNGPVRTSVVLRSGA